MNRSPKRFPKGVCTYWDPRTVEAIDRHAALNGLNRSEFMRKIIVAALMAAGEDFGDGPPKPLGKLQSRQVRLKAVR